MQIIAQFITRPGLLALGITLAAVGFLIGFYPNPLLAVSLVFCILVLGLFLIRPRLMILFLLLIRSSLDITKDYFNVYISSNFQLTLPIAFSLLLIVGGVLYLLAHRIEFLKIPLSKLLILFLLISMVNFPMAKEFSSGLMEFLRLFSAFILYLMVWTIFDTRSKISALIMVIVLSSLVPIGLGIFQILLNRGQFIFGYIRAYGTFVHPNPYAFFLIIILALGLNLYSGRSGWIGRISLLVLMAGAICCLLFTFTRSAWFGLFLLFLVLIWYRERRFIWPFAVLMVAFFFLSPIRARFYDLSTSFNSITHRLYIWQAGLENLPSCPVVGRGLASFAIMDPHGQQAHNDYLRILFELGIPGLVVYLVLIIAVIWKLNAILRRRERSYMSSLACATLSIFVVFQIAGFMGNILFRPALQWYLWALIAVVLKGVELPQSVADSELSGGSPDSGVIESMGRAE